MNLLTWLWTTIPVTTSNEETSPSLPTSGRQRRRISILLSAILATACVLTPILVKASHIHGSVDAFLNAIFVLGMEVIYLFLAHYLILEPDMENLGWYGGLMDNPFHISDNQNRLILLVKSILIPGRIINKCLKDFTYLISKPDCIF